MADLKELDGQIESTQMELQSALSRLKSFTELQDALDKANSGLNDGGEALSTLSEHLALTTQTLTTTVSGFTDAIDAMREATPEALSKNVDLAVGATTRTEKNTAEFQAQLKEEIAEQREALERRVHAVEAGLEQTRTNIGQLKKTVEERTDDLAATIAGRLATTQVLVVLTLLASLAALGHSFWPQIQSLLGI